MHSRSSNGASPPHDGTIASTPSPSKDQKLRPTSSDGRSRKRRKVNHACLYCQRSHMTCDDNRPCARCVKRNIGHLCHDEPRENQGKSESGHANDSVTSLPEAAKDEASGAVLQGVQPDITQALDSIPLDVSQGDGRNQSIDGSVVQITPNTFGDGDQRGTAYDPGAWQQMQNQSVFSYPQNYMFNTSEVSNELHSLNDFLHSSLLDESHDPQDYFYDHSLSNTMGSLSTQNGLFSAPSQQNHPQASNESTQKGSTSSRNNKSTDRTRDYYLTAADPAGTADAEERMNALLRAKYDAGLLKAFNYINGYRRLQIWMDGNLLPKSRDRILMQMAQFRPLFRDKIKPLTDWQLTKVEMWFEQKLMEYDRVFASMAVPACCWRRTGEIPRGNREMAELLDVPLSDLRDGKLALHQILEEDSLVNYWEKFTAIAFDPAQKAILTGCSLKKPSASKTKSRSGERPENRCCFTFTVVRDEYGVPGLIVGNFLPLNTG